MAKPGELKWNEFFKSQNPKSNLQKTNKEKVPAAQYHKDKPVGTLHKNAFSEIDKKSDIPAKPINKPGEVPRRPTNIEISKAILANMPKQMRQPTSAEQLAWAKNAGLIKSKEELEKMQKDWENRFNKWHEAVNSPIESPSSPENTEWASGKSFNSTLSEEERIARNMFVGEDKE